MPTIETASKCIIIEGNPYAKNWVRVRYEGAKVLMFLHGNNGAPILSGQMSNVLVDGEVLNEADFKAFVIANFFCCGGGGGDETENGNAMIEEVTITEETLSEVPVPEGMTPMDIHVYPAGVEASATWYKPVVDGDNLDLSALELQPGDYLVIYGKKAA